jgi:hypothetical protein
VPLDVRDAAGRLLRYMTACGYGSLLSQGRRWSWRAFMPPQKMSSSGIAVRRTASLALAYDRTIQYAAGLSVLLLASPEYWIPAFAGMTTENVARVRILQTQLRIPAARCARVVNESFRPWEGVGNAGCPLHPRSRVHLVVVERTRVTTSTPESPGIPARNGFTAYFVLSPATGLSCHRRRRNCFRRLDASVGASGPHDFAVRIKRSRL